jgi:hypothetical protein
METLLQLLEGVTELVPAQTISRRFKAHMAALPEPALPAGLAKYQEDAFAAALSAVTPAEK